MRYLAWRGYHTVLPQDLMNIRRVSASPLPRKPLLITFDDASQSVYTMAFPILKRLGYVASIFLVANTFGCPAFWDGETDQSPHRLMTLDQVKNLLQEGWDVGGHTLTHPRLTSCSEDVAFHEIKESKQKLEKIFRKEISWFAYPYGDFNSQLKELAVRAEYKLAFATEHGDGTDMAIARRNIGRRTHALRFFWRFHQARRIASR